MRHAVLGLDLNAVLALDPGFGLDAPFVPVVPLGLDPRCLRPVLDAFLVLHAVPVLDARFAVGRVAVLVQDRVVRIRDALPVLGLGAVPVLGAMFVLVRWAVLSRDAVLALVAALVLVAVLVLAPVTRIGAC